VKRRVVVLRLGHRPLRDARVTTHVALTARALGASGMLLASSDIGVSKALEAVKERWGGDFFVETSVNWQSEIKRWKAQGGKVVHLTMYGLNLPEVLDEILENGEELLVVVGAEKVPRSVYQLADWNVAVGGQPHSEIAALAIFLDRLNLRQGRDPLKESFEGGELKIIPSARGKTVKKKGEG